MTYPQSDGTGNPEPPTHAPSTPPPYTGVAPDLGAPTSGTVYEPPTVTAYQPPTAPYQPPAGAFQAPYQPPPPPPSPYGAAPYQQPYAPAGYAPPNLVSPGGRLGAQILDGILIFFTAGIGWLIWALIIFDRGQTPARQILGHTVVDAATFETVTWGRMAVREILLKGLLGYIAGAVTFGVYFFIDSLMVFGQQYQTLHDRMAGTVVVYR